MTPDKLAEIRKDLMYWYFDQGGSENLGDYQKDIHEENVKLHKNFNFYFPFFGFRFNYTRVNIIFFLYII